MNDDAQQQYDDDSAAAFHQEQLDEQYDLLSVQEREELVLWRAMNELRYAIAYCGKDRVMNHVRNEVPF